MTHQDIDDPVALALCLAKEFVDMLPDVGPDHPDEYRRGQKRAYLDAAVRIRRTFGLPPDPRLPVHHA